MRTSPSPVPPLSDIDHDLLELVSELRVVTQTQLERLHPDVPARTVRYRTRRLHQLGLLGRSRPYRERGSAPHHLWPTSKGDALVRGDPPPRRGERSEPNPLFLAHTAAVSELYVVLSQPAPNDRPTLVDFIREGAARETFIDAQGEPRAIAPDVRITLRDPAGRSLVAHVELDLGTMTHARLRIKLAGYLDHAACASTPVPTLLFITTSARRANSFIRTARNHLEHQRWRDTSHRLTIAVSAEARAVDRLLTSDSWHDPRTDASIRLADLFT